MNNPSVGCLWILRMREPHLLNPRRLLRLSQGLVLLELHVLLVLQCCSGLVLSGLLLDRWGVCKSRSETRHHLAANAPVDPSSNKHSWSSAHCWRRRNGKRANAHSHHATVNRGLLLLLLLQSELLLLLVSELLLQVRVGVLLHSAATSSYSSSSWHNNLSYRCPC